MFKETIKIPELKNKIRNTLNNFNRLYIKNELQNTPEETSRMKQKQKDRTTQKRGEEIQYAMKRSNIGLTEVPEGEQKENRAKVIFEEIMAEIFPELMKTSIHRIKNSLHSHSGK